LAGVKSERKLFAGALLATAGAVTPLAAHAAGASCWIFLPAHVPPLLAGLALGPAAGLVTGGVTALADLLWGGRVQGMAFLPIAVELVAYGLVAGLLSRRSGAYGARLVALLGAMLVGRLAYLVAAIALGQTAAKVLPGLFVLPWPGMFIQVVALPLASRMVERWSEA
jgi:hypothetical protein